MADNNIQTLQFTLSAPNGGINTFQTEVNKTTGASVTYDTTGLFKKDPILRSDPVTFANGNKGYITNFAGNARQDYDLGYLRKIAEQSSNQRAAFINKNYTAPQKENFKGMPGVTNVAPTASPGAASGSVPAPGGTPPPAPDLNNPPPVSGQENNELAAPQLEIVPRGSRVQYPKLMKKEQDKIKFTAVEVSKRQGAGGTRLQSSFGTPIYSPVAGSVFLAIQSSISDQNSVDWGPDTVNALDAATFNLSKDLIFGEDPNNAVKTGLQDIYKTAQREKGRIQSFLAGQAAGLNNVLARTDNVVLNPNLELLFQGPQLRPFSFQFKMSARSQPEADDIKKLLNILNIIWRSGRNRDCF